ncbi:hypothetical protein [Paraburkholderia silvatlantica]|uniref:Tetratricopeptide (TPR) repeat protein n=1 Tax=Paraburkholderia silvatlantica TaxID=321895 RepID=A0ABR6FXR8_9BURK|nr:hypothetical protein [Paraburkholderia silvatlantica]MBB2932232.1 tetratricopeptide (TPR) repeat protein [Paraburkholderia silvatlantica]PVY23266.1 hypothetical protein C7411_13049 [Paraburkholderia silvatlantica]PXW29825.1 hypothetical protein C7413_13049 [Paraburkholderia silvatlantica]
MDVREQGVTPDGGAGDIADALATFARCTLGGGLPAQAAALIDAAGQLRDRPDEAVALLERARADAPGHPAPLIALYRFHFYGHRLAQACSAGEEALAVARRALGAGFGAIPPTGDAVRYDAAVRFYLFTLKGLAYLQLRLGERQAARARLAELRWLDPDDVLGGALLAHVLARHEGDDEADDAFSSSAHPARGWAGLPL